MQIQSPGLGLVIGLMLPIFFLLTSYRSILYDDNAARIIKTTISIPKLKDRLINIWCLQISVNIFLLCWNSISICPILHLHILIQRPQFGLQLIWCLQFSLILVMERGYILYI